jgi:chemotaxis protein MotB
MDDTNSRGTEVVIIKRRGGEEAAAGKAGAWKIAYADFVTAMMAFFLVMWLINASNEKTRAQVASYFNPIKLTDTSTGARSLKDMKETRNPQNENGHPGQGSPPSRKDMDEEARLMANPPKSLDLAEMDVAAPSSKKAGLEDRVEVAPALKPDASNPGVGDPFDPRAWDTVKSEPPKDTGAETQPQTPTTKEASTKESSTKDTETQTVVNADPRQPAKSTEQDTEAYGGEAAKSRVKAEEGREEREKEAAALAQQIASRLGADEEGANSALSVVPTADGILISLTERENFEMFETGSAEPRPETMRLVEAIAAAVQAKNGRLVIRGHTDSRPYRNKYYDNWQLSTARAHFARYMLIRSGLDEARIQRIEGVADREPRNTGDPQAPENRRIDILIEGDGP